MAISHNLHVLHILQISHILKILLTVSVHILFLESEIFAIVFLDVFWTATRTSLEILHELHSLHNLNILDFSHSLHVLHILQISHISYILHILLTVSISAICFLEVFWAAKSKTGL